MTQSLSGSHIWVTGAGKGIGHALALHLAELGVRVTASARTPDDLESLAEEARSKALPGTIHPLVLDVTDGEACRAAPAQAAQLAGRPIDYAVLNAGTHKPLRLKEFSAEAVRYLSEVNVIGTANCLEGLLPEMVDRKGGTIAVVASVAGYTGLPTASAYGASKAAVINMIESLKPEADAHGVRLLLVNPGFVRTPLTDKNTFEMPFLMEPEAAAARIARALARKGGFEVTFPRRFTCMMKLLSMLPYGLRFSLTRKTVPADE